MISPAHPTYADVRVFQKEARTLAQAGYEVTLYAKADNQAYPFLDEGVRVVPMKYSSRTGMVFSTPMLIKRLLDEHADIYHLHNPFSLPIVAVLKMFGRKVIYDVHENYLVRVHLRRWIPQPLKPVVGPGVAMSERLTGRFADAMIATQPDVLERIGSKAVLLQNAPIVDGELIEEAIAYGDAMSDDEVRPTGGVRLIYIGGVSIPRGLLEMVQLVEKLNDHLPARLWLMGHSDESDVKIASRLSGWQYVDFLGPRPQAEAFGRVARADIALALLRDEGGHAFANPNKIYEYMALGTPFVANDFPFWRKGIPEGAGGIFVDPTEQSAAFEAARRLIKQPTEASRIAEAGTQYVRENFNWSRESEILLRLYKRLLN